MKREIYFQIKCLHAFKNEKKIEKTAPFSDLSWKRTYNENFVILGASETSEDVKKRSNHNLAIVKIC